MAKKKVNFSDFFGKNVINDNVDKIVNSVFPNTRSHIEFDYCAETIEFKNKIKKNKFIITKNGLIVVAPNQFEDYFDAKALFDVLSSMGIEFE